MPTVTSTIITSLSQLDPEGTYTYADYLTWQFSERIELIRGRLFPMSPAPSTLHQRVSRELSLRIFTFFNRSNCQAFSAPFDVRLPVNLKKGEISTVVQPDLCVICDTDKIDEHGCNGVPDLIIEILSPGNTKREMRDKYRVYEEAGVREYWLIHPLDKEVRIYVLNEMGVFVGMAPVIEEDVLVSTIFPDLQINLQEVFFNQ
jgi:Uma2 family endonuclease